jgi:hypothetical protein
VKDSDFEKWRDRVFGVAVPLFLGWLVFKDFASDGHIDNPFIVVLLCAFASGAVGVIVRKWFG